MPGKFIMAGDVESRRDDFGTSRWLCTPPNTGAQRLTVVEVDFAKGKGHAFHKHPDQEEMILVIAGKV